MILEDRLQRIAFARVISDLIEADFIIENNEMTFFEEINAQFHISQDMLVEAKRKNFEWAAKTLKSLNNEQKDAIKQVLSKLALSDGTCVPLEALQIMSVLAVLDGKGEIFSILSSSDYIENMKIIYIETSEHPEENTYIYNHFRSIYNEFQLAGLDFVYIPKVVEDYSSMGEEYLCKSIGYILPSLAKEKISSIQQELCSITTSRFCRELLNGKMGLRIIDDTPAFLLKIGESYVVDAFSQDDGEKQIYSNYLKVDIREDILSQVIEIVDAYRNLVSCSSIVEIAPKAKKFLYYGFHRSLFDLIAFGKTRAEYKIIINIENRREPSILFRPLNNQGEDEELKLAPQASALYVLMIQQSVFGQGLDWRENISREDKKIVIEKFNSIYTSIGKREEQTEYKDRVVVSRIKKELRKQQSVISNIDSFIPELRMSNNTSHYFVPVFPDMVYVVQDGGEIKMKDSSYWRDL